MAVRVCTLGAFWNWQSGVAGLYKILYSPAMKVLKFRGGALNDLRAFPEAARREAGYQLDKVQTGRPLPTGSQWLLLGRAYRKSGSEMKPARSG